MCPSRTHPAPPAGGCAQHRRSSLGQGQRKPRSTTDLESALGEGGFNNHEKKIITSCHILNMTSRICLKACFFPNPFLLQSGDYVSS